MLYHAESMQTCLVFGRLIGARLSIRGKLSEARSSSEACLVIIVSIVLSFVYYVFGGCNLKLDFIDEHCSRWKSLGMLTPAVHRPCLPRYGPWTEEASCPRCAVFFQHILCVVA